MARFAPLFALLAACTPDAVGLVDSSALYLDSSPCVESAVVDLLNAPQTTVDTLKDLDVHTRAANNLIARGGGFADLAEIDAVAQVGDSAMAALLAYGEGACDGVVVDSCPTDSVLALVNDPNTTAEDLEWLGVYGRGADNLVAQRPFDSLTAVDDVSYVGDVSMEALEAYGAEVCGSELILSPTWYTESHLARVQELLATAEDSVDIAMYGLSDYGTMQALIDASEDGLSIRLLLDGMAFDDDDPAGSNPARYEEAGIDVRTVNKILHHKLAIFDGPRTDLAAADTATVVTSSANWSYSGATKHDENTVVLTGDARLALHMQQEFELLWDNSRDFVWNTELEPVAAIGVTDEDIAAADGSDALFTTDNFRTYVSATYGNTFARNTDTWHVAEALAAEIRATEHTLRIASGHFRAKPIADAVLEVAARGVDVRVYVDGQEYTSDWYFGEEMAEYDDCMAAAEDDGDIADCSEIGVHYAQALAEAGVDVRFKYYAYRWDYSYAPQLHDKFLIVDEALVATGSYNYSPNAEFDTVENVALLRGDRYPVLVRSYIDAFDRIHGTGRDLYGPLVDEIEHGTDDHFDIVFEPMALTRDEVTALKDAIWRNCPDINSEAFRTEPAQHQTCER